MAEQSDPDPEFEAADEPEAQQEELQQHDKPNVQILYETTSAIFANQIIVNSGRDQIILDFSTGIISDHASGRHVLPIQSRIAMTPANAVRLIQTLSGVIQQLADANQAALQKQSEEMSFDASTE